MYPGYIQAQNKCGRVTLWCPFKQPNSSGSQIITCFLSNPYSSQMLLSIMDLRQEHKFTLLALLLEEQYPLHNSGPQPSSNAGFLVSLTKSWKTHHFGVWALHWTCSFVRSFFFSSAAFSVMIHIYFSVPSIAFTERSCPWKDIELHIARHSGRITKRLRWSLVHDLRTKNGFDDDSCGW